MKNRLGTIFFWIGIALTDIPGLAGTNNNTQNSGVQKEQNMSEALDQQNRKWMKVPSLNWIWKSTRIVGLVVITMTSSLQVKYPYIRKRWRLWRLKLRTSACFEAEKQNEVFDENKYNEIEYNNRVQITRLIDKQINKYTNFTIRYADSSVTRFNNTQYRYYANEGSGTDYQRFCYTIVKDKNGKWMIASRTEI